MALHVLDEVRPPKLILAHMGSNEFYDESEEKLCGMKVYFDTAYSILHMNETQFVRMVRKHGADRVLFGTDTPWTYQKECAQRLLSMEGLTDQEKQHILSGNAEKLLGL